VDQKVTELKRTEALHSSLVDMVSSAHTWVHCSQCMSLGSGSTSRLHITSCGRVVCHSYTPSLGAVNCPTCRGPCTKTIPLDSKAPPNVLNLYKDVSGQL